MSSTTESAPMGVMPPPPGVVANFNSPTPGLQRVWVATCIICVTVATMLMFARLLVRCRLMRIWLWADTCFVVAWASFVAFIGISLDMTKYGVGQHVWNVTLQDFTEFAHLLNTQQILYMPAIGLTKTVILLQFLEIFVPNRYGRRWWLVVGFTVVNAIFWIIQFFFQVFQCIPREKIWNPMIAGHCIDLQKAFITNGTLIMVEDFAILALPLFWISKLRMSNAQKYKLYSVFALGFLACATSVVRLAICIVKRNDPDITRALVSISLWATAEITIGMIIACCPFLPRFVEHASTTAQKLSSFASSGGSSKPFAGSRPKYSASSIQIQEKTLDDPEIQSVRPSMADDGSRDTSRSNIPRTMEEEQVPVSHA